MIIAWRQPICSQRAIGACRKPEAGYDDRTMKIRTSSPLSPAPRKTMTGRPLTMTPTTAKAVPSAMAPPKGRRLTISSNSTKEWMMASEVIQAWHVNGLVDLIAALEQVEDMASSEGSAAEEVRSDMRLVSLVRTTNEDGSSVLEVHLRA